MQRLPVQKVVSTHVEKYNTIKKKEIVINTGRLLIIVIIVKFYWVDS